ncbi:rho guanine nucleotide exchange factor 1 isoform X2 [Rana temporaria]|uniref:rho guanine nucleotide exchange factor 1 isoform X2 n=1 Tax=Rana temporaria TaxID=8407 RepID=UPI001AAD3903|nr:rho guanine nucleotide exchange factor 1 isoform X2 [Rana temporaria]
MDQDDSHYGGTHSIIGAEDEDFENDIEPNVDDQSSYFQSIELVKEHPAYIMVFLHHVVLQFDPSPVLCYLHVEILRNLNAKEGKKLFLDFYNTFLMKGAVMRVQIPNSVSFELDRTRPDLIPDDTLKKYLQEIQAYQFPEISRQLEDFRAKRVLGMTPGETELKELESYRTNDKYILQSKEKQLAERLLVKLDDMHPSISPDEEKSSAIVHAIAIYMKHIGVKTKAADSKKPKSGFFRKMVSAKKPDEPPKSKKPFSIWNRNETPHNVDPRPKLEPEADKQGAPERKFSHGQRTFDRSDSSLAKPKATNEGPDLGVSVTIHPPPSDPSDSDTVSDGTSSLDVTDVSKGSPTTELCPTDQQEDSAENDRNSSKLGRSESLRVYERKRSQRGSAKGKQARSRSDVDLEAAARANDLQLSSSKSSSKSGNFTPEPGGSADGPPSFLLPQSEETEPRVLEIENDPPNWRELVPPETLLRLTKSEIKRQEVINELLFTEHAHVRMLRVLHDIFYLPMLNSWIPNMELENIFPSLDDLIDAHALFLDNLKKLRQENNSVIQEIGDTLLQRFDGTEGQWFQKISSRFCSRQPFALEQLKQKQKKDPRFTQFIQEAESHPQCRRLQLKDIIPFEMQRLTKYPLLLQNIANLTEEDEEKQKVQKAAESCRQILNHVNTEVREMENKMKLTDYQRRLDMSNLKQSSDPLFNEFKNIDISKKNLIYEGALTWRVSKDKSVDVHVLLLDDIMMLLQKQDERLVLKCQSRTLTPTPDGKLMLSPIIKLNTAMAREVATDNKAFFVIFKWEDRPQIYELVAPTTSEKNMWFSLVKQSTGHFEPSSSKARMSYSSQRMIPQSPSEFSENGASLKESVTKEEKESLEEAGLGPEESLGDPTLMEHLAHNLGGNVASSALEEVTVLKRLLVRNIRLSLDVESFPNLESWSDFSREETGASQNVQEEKAANGDQEGDNSVPESEREGRDPGENGQVLASRDVGESLCAPIVLSQEQSEEVRRHILLLEEKVHQLKVIEEDYLHLQRTVTKFSVSQSSFT